jgi:hypothetical protein
MTAAIRLPAIITGALLAVLTGCGMLDRPAAAETAGGKTYATDQGPAAEQEIVHIYFSSSDGGHLQAEDQTAILPQEPSSRGRFILEALLNGPRKALERPLPTGVKLRAFFLGADGTGYVDLIEVPESSFAGGCHSEILAVFAVVNSLVLNVPEIRNVQFLVGGRPAPTLAGHVDIRRPFQANLLLIR